MQRTVNRLLIGNHSSILYFVFAKSIFRCVTKWSRKQRTRIENRAKWTEWMSRYWFVICVSPSFSKWRWGAIVDAIYGVICSINKMKWCDHILYRQLSAAIDSAIYSHFLANKTNVSIRPKCEFVKHNCTSIRRRSGLLNGLLSE